MKAVGKSTPEDGKGCQALARLELQLRRARTAAFGSQWSGDSWWDIMLSLYLGGDCGPSDEWTIGVAVGQPIRTISRWLWILEAEGQVIRRAAALDHADVWALTPVGRNRVDQCLNVGFIEEG